MESIFAGEKSLPPKRLHGAHACLKNIFGIIFKYTRDGMAHVSSGDGLVNFSLPKNSNKDQKATQVMYTILELGYYAKRPDLEQKLRDVMDDLILITKVIAISESMKKDGKVMDLEKYIDQVRNLFPNSDVVFAKKTAKVTTKEGTEQRDFMTCTINVQRKHFKYLIRSVPENVPVGYYAIECGEEDEQDLKERTFKMAVQSIVTFTCKKDVYYPTEQHPGDVY